MPNPQAVSDGKLITTKGMYGIPDKKLIAFPIDIRIFQFGWQFNEETNLKLLSRNEKVQKHMNNRSRYDCDMLE